MRYVKFLYDIITFIEDILKTSLVYLYVTNTNSCVHCIQIFQIFHLFFQLHAESRMQPLDRESLVYSSIQQLVRHQIVEMKILRVEIEPTACRVYTCPSAMTRQFALIFSFLIQQNKYLTYIVLKNPKTTLQYSYSTTKTRLRATHLRTLPTNDH